MKKALIILLVLALCLILAALNNNRPETIIGRLIRRPDTQNELRYTVNIFGVIPVAEAIFYKASVQDYGPVGGQKAYHLSAKAQSLQAYSVFFRGGAALDSYIDFTTFNPSYFKQVVSVSGKGESVKEISYDQQGHVMSMAGQKRQITPDTQDPLSAIFNIRRMDFDKVKEFEMNINTNQKNYLLKASARTEEIRVGGQKCGIVIIDATVSRREKSPYHKTSMRMVLWRQRQNLPVYIKVFASGFLMNCRLVDMQ